MDKKIIIGLGAVATAGMIIGGLNFIQSSQDKHPEKSPEGAKTSLEDQKKIEDLYWDELRDEEKYAFCFGTAKIITDYSDPILNSRGDIVHNSRELLLFDKKAGKLSIMTREIDFKYSGKFSSPMGGLTTEVPVSESGTVSEVYSKNEMPERLNYTNNYIVSNPDTKEKNWVKSYIGEEVEMVSDRTGCAGVYTLNNAPGKDLLVGSEQIIIDRRCEESDVIGTYVGDFKFECQAIDYRQASEMYKTVKTKAETEKLEDEKEDDPFDALRDSSDEEVNDASARGELENAESFLKDSEVENVDSEQIKKSLELLRQEMKADEGSQTGN